MELGRWLKPGLQPDFNEVILAAVAAAIANRAMPELWPTLLSMSSLTATTADAMRGSQTQIAMVAIPSATWLSVRLLLSGGFITAGVVLCWGYPLGFLPALAVLTAWVAVLWCFPVLWLVLLPAVLPAVDFSPWTGWIAISEGDIAVLATLAVLLLRAPPTRQDIWPDQRVRLFPRFVLALSLFACAVDIVRGISPNWQAVSETLPAPIQRGALPAPIQRGALPAPVEPAFSTGPGMKVDIADVEMIGPDGRTVVVNGDFTDGTVRWFFTLDFHRLWRILNSPLSVWFEGGMLGVISLSLLLSAFGGALDAIRHGEPLGAPISGAMVGITLCGLFDNVFEAPRIALLFDLAAMLGLMLGWPPRSVSQPDELPPETKIWWIIHRPRT